MQQENEQRAKASLKLKAMVFISLVILAVGALLSWYFLNQTKEVLTAELQKRAISLTKNLAYSSKYGILTEDEFILQELIEGILQEDSVSFVLIADAQGEVLAQGFKETEEASFSKRAEDMAVHNAVELASQNTVPSIHGDVIMDQKMFHAAALVETEEAKLTKSEEQLTTAMLLLGSGIDEDGSEPLTTAMTTQRGSVQIFMSLEAMHANIRKTFTTGIGLTVGIIVAGVFISFAFVGYSLRPIQAMVNAASRIASGDLSQRVEVTSRDEIGLLATTFNRMTESLDQMTRAQQRLNIELEGKVQKRTEALQLQQQELKEVNVHLEKATKHKSEFLAHMSHELRTPLNAIIGFSEVLIEKMYGELNEKQEEYLHDVLTAGRHLLSLINDILDISKIEAGHMELELSIFDLPVTLEKTLTLVCEQASRNGIHLTLQLDEQLGEFTADERKIKQVLLNLLSNAVKFTPAGGEVSLSARLCGELVEISVRDTGLGIPPEDQQQVFEEFHQVKGHKAQKREGTGLGLALTKRFVELHGGTICVESEVRCGSTFTFTLPVRTPVREVSIMMPAAPSQLPLVLVVEDDQSSAKLTSVHLSQAGFNVRIAHNAEIGYEKARSLQPAAITLDILMPGVDGWDLLARLKGDMETAHIPVVIVSIQDEPDKGFALGAAEYLMKPIDAKELVSTVRRVIKAETTAVEHKATVLVVDDDPMTLDLMEGALKPKGFDVLKAGGGGEGLQLAREQPPDLIVLDLLMPDMDGFQVLDALKQDPITADIPIMILTSKTLTPEDKVLLNGRISHLTRKGEFAIPDFVSLLHSVVARSLS